MAEKQTVSTPSAAYIASSDPSAIEANRVYQEALRRLNESLDARKNRLFDPVLLAAAQGFAEPTKTGSFFEALGRVAGGVGKAQEQQVQEQQQIAQLNLQMAQAGLELERQKQRERLIMGVPPGGLPAAAAAPAGRAPAAAGEAPAGGLPTAQAAPRPGGLPEPPPGFEGIPGIPTLPPNPEIGDIEAYKRAAALDPNLKISDFRKNVEEIARSRYKEQPGGIIDLRTGLRYSYEQGGPLIERTINNKTYKVSPAEARSLDFKRATNAPDLAEYERQIIEGPKPGGTALSSESERRRREEFEKAKTETEIETFKDFTARRREADETISTANVFRKFSEDPNASKMFGILNNKNITSAIATLVRDGVGIPGFTVGTKAIEDIMRNAGLNEADQAKYRTFLTYAAMMQLQAQKYMKGAVSDKEQDLLRQGGISAQDTPETIRIKADVLTRRAQFDRRVARAFKASNMSPEEFLDSDQYEKLRDEYNEQVSLIATGQKRLVPAASQASPKPGDPRLEEARRRARQALGQE
jgi:hypothetical protein